MAQITLPFTLVAGTPENVNNVQSNFVQIKDHINNALIGDDNLTSPNNSVWRPVFQAGGSFVQATTPAGTYVILPSEEVNNTTNMFRAPMWHSVSTDVAVAGRTTQVRVRAEIATNATLPGVNFTIGLYPITAVGGGATAMTFTLGAVVATALFTAPAGAVRAEGTAVTLPGAFNYVFAVAVSGTTAVNSMVSISAALEMRHN